MQKQMKANEYDNALDDAGKALAAIAIARRKQTVERSWEWARCAANHAVRLGIHNASTLLGIGAWPDLHSLEIAVMDKRAESILIVTRHPGLVDWLERRSITGTVVERATPSDVLGKHVIGNLPWQLAAVSASYSRMAIPGCPEDRRGENLTADELETYGAFLRTYVVKEVQAIKGE